LAMTNSQCSGLFYRGLNLCAVSLLLPGHFFGFPGFKANRTQLFYSIKQLFTLGKSETINLI
jgi:hypothetical protein